MGPFVQNGTEVIFPSSPFRNAEQNKCLWKLSDISDKSDNEGESSSSSSSSPLLLLLLHPAATLEALQEKGGPVYSPTTDCICVWPPGAGSLRAKFELSKGPSSPSTLAVQFMNEGSTLSGVDMELQGSGYRLSLNKKRFATGTRRVFERPSAAGRSPKRSRFSRLSLRRALHGRLLRRPVTLEFRNDRNVSLTWQCSTSSTLLGSPEHVRAQSGFSFFFSLPLFFLPGWQKKNLTTIKQHWVSNTVILKKKNKDNKKKKRKKKKMSFQETCRYEVLMMLSDQLTFVK